MTEKNDDGAVLGTIGRQRWWENWRQPVPWADRTPEPAGTAAIGFGSDRDAREFAEVMECLVDACMWADRPALECVVMYTTEAGLMMQVNNGFFFCMVEYLRPLIDPETLTSPALFWNEDLRRLYRGLRSGSCSLLFMRHEEVQQRTLALTSEQALSYLVNAPPLYEQTETYPDTGSLIRKATLALEAGVMMEPSALNCEFIQWLGKLGNAVGLAPIRFLQTGAKVVNLMETLPMSTPPTYRGFVGMMPMFIDFAEGG